VKRAPPAFRIEPWWGSFLDPPYAIPRKIGIKGRNVCVKSRVVTLALTLLAAVLSSASASEHQVGSAADVSRLEGKVRAGDVLVMADGTWTDQAVRFRGKGSPDQPLTLRARTPGKVILTGKSSLEIDGENLVVSGLCFRGTSSAKETVKVSGRECRLTDVAIVGCDSKFYVRLFGISNRVDHCFLAGKTSDSPTLQVEVEGQPNRHRIDHNHFGPRPPLGRNGGETIRVGYSEQSMLESGTRVERNLFDRCDGELEIVSNKSCGNVYQFNTFLECAGMLTLRHGNRCTVEGNFFLGHHKKGSGGIRVIGEDHTVVNNYVDGVDRGGFWLTSGIPDSPLNGYVRARNVLIAFNTVVDSKGPCVDLDAGYGSSRRTLRPERITIANNVFSVPGGGLLFTGKEGEGFVWAGNVAWGASASPAHPGVQRLDPRLARAGDGLSRPATDSPVRGAAAVVVAVKTDVDGQIRDGKSDAGCDELADGPVTNRPLSASDVGTSWPASERGTGRGEL
jgi:poly(beta-D-mannuronate) lyase